MPRRVNRFTFTFRFSCSLLHCKRKNAIRPQFPEAALPVLMSERISNSHLHFAGLRLRFDRIFLTIVLPYRFNAERKTLPGIFPVTGVQFRNAKKSAGLRQNREREITSRAKAPAVYEADHGVFFYGKTAKHQIAHVNCC
jgi:hypothetical protein